MSRSPSRSSPYDLSHRPERRGKKIEDEAKEREIEEYSQLYFKYMKLFEDISAPMRHDQEGILVAYNKVYAEAMEERATRMLTRDGIHLYLEELARRCEVPPRSFEE
jgi:hypothetical protein